MPKTTLRVLKDWCLKDGIRILPMSPAFVQLDLEMNSLVIQSSAFLREVGMDLFRFSPLLVEASYSFPRKNCGVKNSALVWSISKATTINEIHP